MKALVVGGTGLVGSNVVQGLLARKAEVRVLTRDASKAPDGAIGYEADLLVPETLPPAFEGVDAVFMVNGLSPTETHEGLMGVNAAVSAGVKRLVYSSVQNVDRYPLMPHFAAKVPIERAVKESGIPYTILRPNSFIQNDARYREALLNGVYPQPLGDVGVQRVDVRDIAEAAVVVMTTSGHEGKTYNLVGPKVESGSAIAALWSAALGRPVAYFGNDLEAWSNLMAPWLPAWLVYDLRMMYAAFMKDGLEGTDADLATVTKLLGHAPRSSEAAAKEIAATWSVAAKA